ncbi:MAG: hypothetical protein L0287_27560 [Anaerolineae bacterium]|nr:hypothetical protein [Anaerolineae bacterium]MCI0607637.1 hypothetical protein [Anaerolineae bacterium]
MTNQKAENEPIERDPRIQSPKKRFVKFGILIVFSLSAAILLYVSGVFATVALYLSRWWISIPPKAIESILSIAATIFLGVVTNAIWDLIKFVISQRRSRHSNIGGDKTERNAENPLQINKPGTNNDIVISGDNNIIQITQIIFKAYDFVGKSLGTSPETTQKVVELLNEIIMERPEVSDNSTHEKSLDYFRSALRSVENEMQNAEFMQILEDLSNLLQPIIDKNSKYEREHDYPYAEFCGDFVEALKYSRNIRNSFTTIPITTTVISGGRNNHHGRNTAIHLRVLSKFLPFSRHFGDYYLAGQDERYGLSNRFDKISLCVLGKLRWQKRAKKPKREDDGSWSIEADLERLEFSDRHIMIYDEYLKYNDFKYPYPFRLDWEKFSTFITGLTADFILISFGTMRHDREFNEKINDLFSRLVQTQKLPSTRT